MKHHSLSKVLKRLACVLAALVIALAVAVFALWHNELATLSSLKKLSDRDEAHRDGAVYQLNVSGGYYFDDFLAQGGASTDSELISFITQSITKGIIPMNNQDQHHCLLGLYRRHPERRPGLWPQLRLLGH